MSHFNYISLVRQVKHINLKLADAHLIIRLKEQEIKKLMNEKRLAKIDLVEDGYSVDETILK